eukprot:COSAG06_NODE_1207_length_10262_cov_14.644396_12_plen_83_part_00
MALSCKALCLPAARGTRATGGAPASHSSHVRPCEPPALLTQPAPAVVAAASPAQAAAAAAMQSGQSNVVDQDEAPAPQYIYY